MIAELLGAGLEQQSPTGRRISGLQRVFALARRLEDVAAVDLLALDVAGLARDAKLVLGLIVERLEFGIAHRPVGRPRSLRDGGCAVALDGLGAHAEIVFVQAP